LDIKALLQEQNERDKEAHEMYKQRIKKTEEIDSKFIAHIDEREKREQQGQEQQQRNNKLRDSAGVG
jgi:hypothetical protein